MRTIFSRGGPFKARRMKAYHCVLDWRLWQFRMKRMKPLARFGWWIAIVLSRGEKRLTFVFDGSRMICQRDVLPV